jgi:hypothetical protein
MERSVDHSHRRDEPQEIADWRRDVLLRAGFSTRLADELAREGRIDLHDLLKLIDRGCPPDLAARILAPL